MALHIEGILHKTLPQSAEPGKTAENGTNIQSAEKEKLLTKHAMLVNSVYFHRDLNCCF